MADEEVCPHASGHMRWYNPTRCSSDMRCIRRRRDVGLVRSDSERSAGGAGRDGSVPFRVSDRDSETLGDSARECESFAMSSVSSLAPHPLDC